VGDKMTKVTCQTVERPKQVSTLPKREGGGAGKRRGSHIFQYWFLLEAFQSVASTAFKIKRPTREGKNPRGKD